MSDSVSSDPISVLIVDDEQGLTDLYALYLDDGYETRTAYDGETALEVIDDDVDVVLLDRRMPGLSGDQVLAELRDRGFDQPLAMLTAVDPGDDILTMDLDHYFVKPIDKDEIREIVDMLAARIQYDEVVREYFALVSKQAAMEANVSVKNLAASDAYHQLKDDVDAAKADADRASEELSEADWAAELHELS